MKAIIALLLASLPVGNAFSRDVPLPPASIYHGIFYGTVENTSDFNFNDGDLFTLKFEIDTISSRALSVELDVGDVTGTFGNAFSAIQEFENIASTPTTDRFQMITTLDSPDGIFDGQPNSNIAFEFYGGPEVFSGSSLAQSFSYADFYSLSGSMDIGGYYEFNLNFTSGAYLPGSLPSVPLPAAMWLFGSGLLGLFGFAQRKKT